MDQKWSRARLRIFNSRWTHAEISDRFRHSATARDDKGRGGVLWALDSGVARSSPMEDHLAAIVQFLEAHRNVFQNADRGFDADIFCGFSSQNGQGGLMIPTSLMAVFVECNVPIVLDLYPPGDPLESSVDPFPSS